MAVEIRIGDCRELLRAMPDESVHCVVTSPPYWGLRDYGTAKWVGGDDACDHSYQRGGAGEASSKQVSNGGTQRYQYTGICPRCGAERVDGQLGMERTLGEHIETMVDVFREVRRVLRKDGTVWLNYGDCYAASANGRSAADTKALGNDDRTFRDKPFSTVGGVLKPKDLCMIPNRIAIALQEDGWWVRSEIVWHKPNPMPESIKDRPGSSHEKIWLLAKSERYYYDHEAVAEDAGIWPGHESKPRGSFNGKTGDASFRAIVEKRNLRNVWTIPTSAFPEAHFATFPPALIEPCIKAGCPVGGTVLDPFGGAGTTGLVADRLKRNAVLLELNPEYAAIAERRIAEDAGMFGYVAVSEPPALLAAMGGT